MGAQGVVLPTFPRFRQLLRLWSRGPDSEPCCLLICENLTGRCDSVGLSTHTLHDQRQQQATMTPYYWQTPSSFIYRSKGSMEWRNLTAGRDGNGSCEMSFCLVSVSRGGSAATALFRSDLVDPAYTVCCAFINTVLFCTVKLRKQILCSCFDRDRDKLEPAGHDRIATHTAIIRPIGGHSTPPRRSVQSRVQTRPEPARHVSAFQIFQKP
jgi:hypothetical protein